MQAILIAGGEITSPAFYAPLFAEERFIICADGGYQNAKKLGIRPHLVISDFDSYPQDALAGEETIVLPVEKDRTDSQAALEYLLDNGYTHIKMIGCMGTRFDHTLANVHLLALAADRGAQAVLIQETNQVMLCDHTITVPRLPGYKLSLLPLGGPVRGITATGVYYPLTGQDMELSFPYGVSNEFTADHAEISVQSGRLLVMLCKD